MNGIMKKLCVTAFTAVTVFSIVTTICLAAPKLTAERDADGRVSVKVVTDAKYPNYLIYILKPGTAADGMVQLDGTLQGLYKWEQLKEGSPVNSEYDRYSYSFSVEEAAAFGEYCVIAVGTDLDAEDKAAQTRFVIAVPEDEEKALKAVTVAPAEAALLEYQGKAWYVDFENEVYKANKSEVLASFAEICKNPNCGGEVQQAFEMACTLTELKHAPASQVYQLLYAHEDDFGLAYCKEIQDKDDGFLKSFTDLRADVNTNPIRTVEELKSLLRNAEGLSRINAAKRETVIEELKEFEDVFGLSETLSGADGYAVAKEILATTGNEYTSVAQVVTAVQNAVKKLSADSNNNSGGPGGSVISVSGSGSNYITSATQDTMNNISPFEDKNSGFQDLQGAEWAEGYIEYMNYAGIMTGDGDGNFRPADPITREEFVKALLSALKLTGDDSTAAKPMTFDDVDDKAWYYETVEIAYRTGIASGMDDSVFGIGQPITRQDAAAMVIRARYAAKLAFRRMADTVEFSDSEEIAGYALSAVTELQKAGVLSGYEDGTFKPQNSITRAETAKMLYVMLDGLGKLQGGIE